MRDFVNTRTFAGLIFAVIFVNCVAMAAQTYVRSPTIDRIEHVCTGIFVLELLLKFAYRTTTRAFFTDGWNVFDIVVVAAAFVPGVGEISTALRILRVFRALRVIQALPELRLTVRVLSRSVVSMGVVSVLVVVLVFVYAIVGVELFGKTQPAEYGTLHEACFSLFRTMTLEDWTDIRYDGITAGGNWFVVTAFHVSWVLIATYLMLNLVVGAIISNYSQVHEAEKQKQKAAHRKATEAVMDASDRRLELLLNELQEVLAARLEAKREAAALAAAAMAASASVPGAGAAPAGLASPAEPPRAFPETMPIPIVREDELPGPGAPAP